MSNFEDLSPEEKEYVLNLPYHLSDAGMADDYCKVLTEFEFLQYKLFKLLSESPKSIIPIIEDYDLQSVSNLRISEQMQSSLKSLQGALKLSNNFLAQDSNQLATQLYGRLMFHKANEIQSLLNQIKERKNPWFRLITPSLSTPDGPEIYTLSGHKGAIHSVAVFSDGKKAISASSDHTLKVWDLEKGTEIHTLGVVKRRRGTGTMWIPDEESTKKLESFIGNILAITPNSKRLISGSSDRTLKVWDLESGNLEFTLIGHNYEINSVAITPDDKQVISKSYDGLRIWDLNTGLEISSLDHEVQVGKFVVLPDNRWIVFSRLDNLKIWNWQDGKTLASLTWDSLYRFAVTDDAKTIVIGDGLGQVHVLRLEGIENFSIVDSNLSRKQIEIENKNLDIPSNNLSQPYNFLLASVFRHSDQAIYEMIAPIALPEQHHESNKNAIKLSELALLYQSLGGYEKIEVLFFQVLEDNRRSQGVEHPAIATILDNIANLYELQEEYKKAQSIYQQARMLREKILPSLEISRTKEWTDKQIQTKIAEVKYWLDWDNTMGRAKKWWETFENENKQRLPLVLRLCEELARRRVTITDFFKAYSDSGTDNIQANLDYMDYIRLKRESGLKYMDYIRLKREFDLKENQKR
ncbi:MAG: tetratricopeptide repeat protein [Scytonema sp. PMC 1070.18]|nr:tetratricopeptide repeat protein [Scytonema sp. PMC 1070.18]